jgi:hypothetical protein
MADYLDTLLAPDDEVAATVPFPQCPNASVGLVVSERARSSAEIEQDEARMILNEQDGGFGLTFADYQQLKTQLTAPQRVKILIDLLPDTEFRERYDQITFHEFLTLAVAGTLSDADELLVFDGLMLSQSIRE